MSVPIQIRDLMSTPVQTIPVDATVGEAATECYERDINSLVVVEGDDVVGVVTGTDLLEILGAESRPEVETVGEVMSTPVITISPGRSVTEGMQEMSDHDVARLVVMDGDELVGLISTDDIIRYVPQVFHRAGLADPSGEQLHYRVRQETAYENPEWTFEATSISGDAINVGDTVEFSKRLTEEDVRTFAAISGDTNRLHLDEEYAEGTRFGRRIVHGTLVGGLISAALARLPGLTIYLSQDLSFLGPVDIGTRVTAHCEVVGKLGKDKFEVVTDVMTESGDPVIEGEATVLVDVLPEAGHVEAEPIDQ